MKKLLSSILVLVLLISSIGMGESVNAATKTTITDKKLTIGVGKGIWQPTTISLNNKIEKATYTFISSNTKIAKVGKKTGALAGIQAGTVSITVTQNYKNKSNKIGTCKVTVVDSAKDNSENVKNEGFTTFSENRTVELYLDTFFDYINTNAEYTVTSSKTNVAKISGKANKGNKYSVSLQTAGVGTTTLTVVQCYKGKTKTVGKVNIKVVDVYLDAGELEDKSFDILDGYFAAYINYPDGSKGCNIVSSDENIIKIKNSNSNETTGTTVYEFEFVSKGTATLTYYEGETIIGTRKITVTSVEATEAKYSEGTEIIQLEMPNEGTYVNSGITFKLLPQNSNGKYCIVEIADESICVVKEINAYSGVIYVDLDVKRTGTTTIVVKNGDGKEIYKGILSVVEEKEE